MSTIRLTLALVTAGSLAFASGCCHPGGLLSGGPAAASPEGQPAQPQSSGGVAAGPTSYYSVGDLVLANWQQGGDYYLGAVTGADDSGVDVVYLDESREHLAPPQLLSDRFSEGVRVEVPRPETGESVSGVIDRRVGHAVLVTLGDGVHLWLSMLHVRATGADLANAAPVPADTPDAPVGEIGSRVLALWPPDGCYYSAVVVGVEPDSRRTVIYTDGTREVRALGELRPDTIAPSLTVEAGPEFAPATVVRRNAIAAEVRSADGTLAWHSLTLVRVPASP